MLKFRIVNTLCLICFMMVLPKSILQAQEFRHIERLAKLDVLEENNGFAIADYDGDLDLDIFVVAKAKDKEGVDKSHSRLFSNNNDGTFTDVTLESGLFNLLPHNEFDSDTFLGLSGFKIGASWGDYDNDGFPDLFLTSSFKVQLFHNEGDGTFTEVTTSAGITVINNCNNTGATWFDYNNDGYLDLYINQWTGCKGNTLYKNNADGTFTDVSLVHNVTDFENGASFTLFPYDFNNDSYQDIYILNDNEIANNLFLSNNGTNYTDVAEDYGVDSKLDDMGITMGDFNNDGHFDIFLTGIDEVALLQNNGDNTFNEVSNSKNIMAAGWAWGTRFADFDLDGDQDLFIVNGFDIGNRGPEENVYYKNLLKQGKAEFENVTDVSGLKELTISVEAIDFDYDNDGDLDIFVTNSDRPSNFYENTTLNAETTKSLGWLKVYLEGTISNRDAIGTRVEITTDKGAYSRYYNGVGFLSQSLKPIHFGFEKSATISSLKITWPSGIIETYDNIESNSHLKFIEQNGYEILNITPSVKQKGCTDPNSCSYDPEAVVDDGSCVYIPHNEIVGNKSSGFLRTESYTYKLTDGSTAQWFVEGGELLSGQGTETVEVLWGMSNEGKITVREKNNTCFSLDVEIQVALNFSKYPSNQSIARLWNEALLEAIRNDYARPTVHARNLFHTSIALYDIWAIYDENAKPYLIGNTVHSFKSELKSFTRLEGRETSRNKAMSYAAYRLLSHRFKNSPGAHESLERFNRIMEQLNYDVNNTSVNYETGDAAALGNFVAQTIINYGKLDNSRESTDYDNAFYTVSNPPLNLHGPKEIIMLNDPNRWQPLTFNTFIDQSGHVIPGSTPSFLSPEWGNVYPFALSNEDKAVFSRNGNEYPVYHKPLKPPYLNVNEQTSESDLYKWNFSLVSLWSAHLDTSDGVLWDISPKTIGNIDIDLMPDSFSDYDKFYKELDGGDIGTGHALNPVTGMPYKEQLVPRADYARVLAEFWADGPDSETPPGHWFTILNYVNDHPQFVKRFNGEGNVLNPIEWDVKAYFVLSGALHDSAIAAWGIKGWFDYIRPISAIRYMCELGQCTDSSLPNYHIGGIPLIENFVEVIKSGDPLSGSDNENVGKIKLYAWRGHEFIDNVKDDMAGVGWILAENWWPYQRPSFVTPPFAGYVSGHSTFSRAAAEVLTLITGDAFFPGGMGEFVAKKDEFLVFEKGPSVDVRLQWATYRDASDQTSLSRIWGGIHPPADDIPGRKIGEKIGIAAYNFALPYFNSEVKTTNTKNVLVYPNPVNNNEIMILNYDETDYFQLFDLQGRLIENLMPVANLSEEVVKLKISSILTSGLYVLKTHGLTRTLIIQNH